MKKILITLLAVFAMVAVSSGAYAAIDTGNLVVAVYNEDGNEIVYDLGTMESVLGALNGTVLATVDLTDMEQVSYMSSTTGLMSAYVYVGANKEGLTLDDIKTNTVPATNGLAKVYANATSGDVHAADWEYSFLTTTGIDYGNMLDRADSALYISGATVSSDLMYITNEWGVFTMEDTGRDLVLDTTTGVITVSTVPVPGAVWLLGSSLLGVVGLRRKKNS